MSDLLTENFQDEMTCEILPVRPGPVVVQLAWHELYVCATVAAVRMIGNMQRRVRAKHGAPDVDGRYELDFFGCCGELALSKHTNLFWSGAIPDITIPDVGYCMDSRAGSKAHFCLVLHPDDVDDRPYVLTLVHALPRVTLAGWMFARDGKQQRHWRAERPGSPSFFVPQADLRDMTELDALLPQLTANAKGNVSE